MTSEEAGRPAEAKKVAVFTTTHQTLKAEKLLKESRIRVHPIPKPRRIQSECGLALEFDLDDEARLLEVCQRHRLELVGTFPHPA